MLQTCTPADEAKHGMNAASRKIQRTYLLLLLFHTMAASLIWGINTLFLLDAGLNNGQAFAANAFFTAGLMLFEIPTGVVADTRGRRFSYLLGTLTLAISTVSISSCGESPHPSGPGRCRPPFSAWVSHFSRGQWRPGSSTPCARAVTKGGMESVFARGKIVEGAAMLAGSVAGGYIAQATNLGVPVHHPGRVLLILVRAGVVADARHRVQPASQRTPPRRDQYPSSRINPAWIGDPTGPLGHARRSLH